MEAEEGRRDLDPLNSRDKEKAGQTEPARQEPLAAIHDTPEAIARDSADTVQRETEQASRVTEPPAQETTEASGQRQEVTEQPEATVTDGTVTLPSGRTVSLDDIVEAYRDEDGKSVVGISVRDLLDYVMAQRDRDEASPTSAI